MMKVRRLLGLALAGMLIVAFSLTACAPSQPAQQFTLRIGILGTQDSLPYLIMREQGIDKKFGLQFIETIYPSGAAIIDALAGGSLDVGATVGSTPVLTAAEQGLIPDKIIPAAANNFADPAHPGSGVLVAPDITKWQDLEGKQIAVVAVNSLQGVAIKGRLQQEGIKDYKLVEISFSNMGLAVAGGNVAAAAMAEPYVTQSLLRNDGKLLGWIIGGPPFENMEFTMAVFSTSLYRDNPGAVKAYLRAHLEAVKWLNQHLDESRSILARRLSLSSEVSKNINLLRFPEDGRNDPALLDSMQPVMINTGMLKAPIPAVRLYDETLLNEVLKEKR